VKEVKDKKECQYNKFLFNFHIIVVFYLQHQQNLFTIDYFEKKNGIETQPVIVHLSFIFV